MPDDLDERTIDTIVIGGSAGAFPALGQLLETLPPGLPAQILAVLHTGPGGSVHTAKAFGRRSAIPVATAEDGMALRHGTVLLAPPDAHLFLGDAHVHCRRGPRENGFRPAIDPLFRSAAVYAGPRAVAVVLSGMLDDGAAGARAVARAGGRVLVQDPGEADFADMPRAALAMSEGRGEALSLSELAQRIARLAGTPAGAPTPVPAEIALEMKIATLEEASMSNAQTLGTLAPFNCPHCNGVLWAIEDGAMTRYRCHTGHAYTSAALAASQDEALERSLFDALRAHRGRAELIRRMAEEAGEGAHRERLHERARSFDEDGDLLERLISARTSS